MRPNATGKGRDHMGSWLDSDSSGPQWWWSDYHRERWERDNIQDLQASVSAVPR